MELCQVSKVPIIQASLRGISYKATFHKRKGERQTLCPHHFNNIPLMHPFLNSTRMVSPCPPFPPLPLFATS